MLEEERYFPMEKYRRADGVSRQHVKRSETPRKLVEEFPRIHTVRGSICRQPQPDRIGEVVRIDGEPNSRQSFLQAHRRHFPSRVDSRFVRQWMGVTKYRQLPQQPLHIRIRHSSILLQFLRRCEELFLSEPTEY